jgi:hypothetical protein
VANHWVINASPVILLAKAEVIQFLPQLCDELVIPAAVVSAVHNVHISDAGKIWLASDGKNYVKPFSTIHPALANWRGGAGEGEWSDGSRFPPGYRYCKGARIYFQSQTGTGKTAWRRRLRH